MVEETKLSWGRRFCISTTYYSIFRNIPKLETLLSSVPACRSTEHSETKVVIGDSQFSEKRNKKYCIPRSKKMSRITDYNWIEGNADISRFSPATGSPCLSQEKKRMSRLYNHALA